MNAKQCVLLALAYATKLTVSRKMSSTVKAGCADQGVKGQFVGANAEFEVVNCIAGKHK